MSILPPEITTPTFFPVDIDPSLDHRSSSQTSGWLDDELHSARKKTHRRDQVGVGNGDHVVHQLANHGKSMPSQMLSLRAVGDGFRNIDMDDRTSF